jgi:hypothetical protein
LGISKFCFGFVKCGDLSEDNLRKEGGKEKPQCIFYVVDESINSTSLE